MRWRSCSSNLGGCGAAGGGWNGGTSIRGILGCPNRHGHRASWGRLRCTLDLGRIGPIACGDLNLVRPRKQSTLPSSAQLLHAKIMSFIVNDIVWWKISLESVVNSWIPGVFTFFLGMWLSKIDDRRKLKQKLKYDLLEVFIPIFNSGQSISITEAENAAKKMRDTFNAYRRIHPNIFCKDTEEKLNVILAEGFIAGADVNKAFMEPDKIQDLIKTL